MPMQGGNGPALRGPPRGNMQMQMRQPQNGPRSRGGPSQQERVVPQDSGGYAQRSGRPGPGADFSKNQPTEQYQQRTGRPIEARKPLMDRHSPVLMSYDNPFPVFPSKSNVSRPNAEEQVDRRSPPAQIQRPGTAPGTRTKDLYAESSQRPLPRPSQSGDGAGSGRSVSNGNQEESQWQEMPTHDGYYGPPSAQFTLPIRPGSAPGTRSSPSRNGENARTPRPRAPRDGSFSHDSSSHYVEADSFPVYEMSAEAPREAAARFPMRQPPQVAPQQQRINWAPQPAYGGHQGHDGGPQQSFADAAHNAYGAASSAPNVQQSRPLPPTGGMLPQRQGMNDSYGLDPSTNVHAVGFPPTPRTASPRPGGRTNLPDRSRVDRPAFYPAAGEPSGGVRIAVSSPPNVGGPDRLPAHPEPPPRGRQPPVHYGVMQDLRSASQPPKPPPIRQYASTGSESSRPSLDRPNTAPVPVRAAQLTHQDLARLREAANANPADSKLQLTLAQKLVEASNTLADHGGTVDEKTLNNNRERYVLDAHKIVKKLVHNGYPDAMFYLGDCLSTGALGLENDSKEAFTLYLAAAKAGHPAAAYRTAVCCEIGPEEGGGTRRDPTKAVQWYKRAASLGDVPAMYKLGMIQLKGMLGQDINAAEGAGWLKRAAERADVDNPHALHELALLYEGPAHLGVIPDEAQALQLFTKAGRLGYKCSQFRLGQAYEFGRLGCPIDSRQSIVWYTKAAAQGEHQSELALSGWYLTGAEGILEHSDSQAYLWARKAAGAEPPLPKAMFAMGYFTEQGIGCKASLEEAKKWYSRAAGK